MAKSNKLRNILIGAGVAAAGAVGTKFAVDYLRNRGKEEPVDESQGDSEATSDAEVTYVSVEADSVQGFLDSSFGNPGRYTPNRPPKIFDYQGQQYMVIWAFDNEKQKNQMLAFLYTDEGRKIVASVGYTNDKTDYNVNLSNTPLAVEVNDEQITSGEGETGGASEVDLVPAGA